MDFLPNNNCNLPDDIIHLIIIKYSIINLGKCNKHWAVILTNIYKEKYLQIEKLSRYYCNDSMACNDEGTCSSNCNGVISFCNKSIWNYYYTNSIPNINYSPFSNYWTYITKLDIYRNTTIIVYYQPIDMLVCNNKNKMLFKLTNNKVNYINIITQNINITVGYTIQNENNIIFMHGKKFPDIFLSKLESILRDNKNKLIRYVIDRSDWNIANFVSIDFLEIFLPPK